MLIKKSYLTFSWHVSEQIMTEFSFLDELNPVTEHLF